MSQGRPESRSSCNISISHGTHDPSLSENQKVLHYMDNVFNKLVKVRNSKVIIVSKNSQFIKSNMANSENAKFVYSSVSMFADKIKIVMNKLFKDDPVQCIRLKGSKHGEIFMTFDDILEILVIDK